MMSSYSLESCYFPCTPKGGRGALLLFYVAGSPHFPSLSPTQRTHFFARLESTWSCCCCAVSLVLVWCFIIYSLPRDVHRLFRHFAGLSFHTNFRKYFRYLGILVSSRICGVIYASFTSSGMWSLLAVFLTEDPDEVPF